MFTKVEVIKIPSTINNILQYNDDFHILSPFLQLPNLKNIEVDKDNEIYEVPLNSE